MCYLIVNKRTGEIVAFTRNVDSDSLSDTEVVEMRVYAAIESDLIPCEDYAYIEDNFKRSVLKNILEI